MYILDVCMNHLNCPVSYKFVILLHLPPYTLKTNDLTNWLNFVDRMAYQMYLLDAFMNDLTSRGNY